MPNEITNSLGPGIVLLCEIYTRQSTICACARAHVCTFAAYNRHNCTLDDYFVSIRNNSMWHHSKNHDNSMGLGLPKDVRMDLKARFIWMLVAIALVHFLVNERPFHLLFGQGD